MVQQYFYDLEQVRWPAIDDIAAGEVDTGDLEDIHLLGPQVKDHGQQVQVRHVVEAKLQQLGEPEGRRHDGHRRSTAKSSDV